MLVALAESAWMTEGYLQSISWLSKNERDAVLVQTAKAMDVWRLGWFLVCSRHPDCEALLPYPKIHPLQTPKMFQSLALLKKP